MINKIFDDMNKLLEDREIDDRSILFQYQAKGNGIATNHYLITYRKPMGGDPIILWYSDISISNIDLKSLMNKIDEYFSNTYKIDHVLKIMNQVDEFNVPEEIKKEIEMEKEKEMNKSNEIIMPKKRKKYISIHYNEKEREIESNISPLIKKVIPDNKSRKIMKSINRNKNKNIVSKRYVSFAKDNNVYNETPTNVAFEEIIELKVADKENEYDITFFYEKKDKEITLTLTSKKTGRIKNKLFSGKMIDIINKMKEIEENSEASLTGGKGYND